MGIYVNINGVNKAVTQPSVNIDGTWKNVNTVYNNINGVWKTSYSPVSFTVTSSNRSMIGYTDTTTNLVIPKTFVGEDGVVYRVTGITNAAFNGCTALTSVTIPNSVGYISNGAFSGCTSLTSVTIPNSVTKINGYVFQNCTALTSVTIPNSVTSIEFRAFGGCTALKTVYYEGTAEQWNAIDINNNGNFNNYIINATKVYNYTG